MNLAWFVGLYKTPIVISCDFGKSKSKIKLSIPLQFRALELKHKSSVI